MNSPRTLERIISFTVIALIAAGLLFGMTNRPQVIDENFSSDKPIPTNPQL
jgi:hypothetical protein